MSSTNFCVTRNFQEEIQKRRQFYSLSSHVEGLKPSKVSINTFKTTQHKSNTLQMLLCRCAFLNKTLAFGLKSI